MSRSVARYGKNLSKYVNKIIKSKEERKCIDRQWTSIVDNDGAIFDLGQLRYIRQGTASNERVGGSIDISSIMFRAIIQQPPPGENTEPLDTVLRVIVFQWHEDFYNRAPDVKDIISYYSQANPYPDGVSGIWSSFYNKENAGSYTIIMDKTFVTSFYGGNSISFCKKVFSAKIPKKTIEYSDNGSPNFFATSDDVFILLISNIDTSGLYAAPTITWSSRTTYTDS